VLPSITTDFTAIPTLLPVTCDGNVRRHVRFT